MDESVKKKPGGQVGLLIVGFGLAAMGGLFVWALWQGYERARVTQAWVETPCVVVEAGVKSFLPTPHSPVAFRFLVEYEYEFAGKQYVGTRYKRIDGPTSQEDRAEGKLERIPAGEGDGVLCGSEGAFGGGAEAGFEGAAIFDLVPSVVYGGRARDYGGGSSADAGVAGSFLRGSFGNVKKRTCFILNIRVIMMRYEILLPQEADCWRFFPSGSACGDCRDRCNDGAGDGGFC